jgi:tetraacyldisaccharide 4'-kinase
MSPAQEDRIGAAALLASPLSLLYWTAWQAYWLPFRLGLRRPKKPHTPIICIGSLLAGGAGKTPVTVHLIDVLESKGYKTVLAASGYRSPHYKNPAAAPDGELDPREWGDEPALIRSLRPQVPIVIGKDRVRLAEIIQERWPDHVMLMDDGFQHLELEKDLTIVLDPDEVTNNLMLPAGPYREPRKAGRSRADVIFPGEFTIETQPTRFIDPDGVEVPTPEEAQVICAIGRPSRFVKSLETAGVAIRGLKTLPDHDPLNEGNLFSSFEPEIPVVVTGKDWVKLRHRKDLAGWTILSASHDVSIAPASRFDRILNRSLPADSSNDES